MSTTSAVAPMARHARVPFVDGTFLKRFVILCGIVPGALLAFDAIRGNLGVNSVNYAIRSTGMIGLVFLTLSLLVTPLRQLTNWSVLISARRNLGVYGFGYILTHFLIFFWFDRDGDIGSTLAEIVGRVYLWFGMGALVLMIPLAITSFDSMVTRLGAKRWKALHRLAYVAVFGGVVHFFLLVKSDTRRPIAFSIAFGGLMLYRMVKHEVDIRVELAKARSRMRPAKPTEPRGKRKFWSGELVVARIFQETRDVKTFRFVVPGGGPLPFDHTAGQYLNLALMINGKRVNRSYTIASSPTRAGYVEISVKRAQNGYGSHHMHATVREGDRIKVSAPAGKFVFGGHEAKRIVMLAGGVGITPMMSIVRALTDRCWDGEIYLLFAVRKRSDIIFESELAYLEKRFGNLHVHITLSDDPDAAWEGSRGRISREMIDAVVPDLKRGPVMMCGPDAMMKAMRRLLVEEMKLPDAEVLEEAFVSPPAPAETSAVAEDAIEAAETVVEPPANDAANITFRKTGKSAELTPEQTLLEAAEDCGIAIPFECRSGICGQCKTKLVSGSVTMEVHDALTSGDRAKGLVLACQARAMQDVVVDA
jgi:ferredoxin-NADP reductase/DMSO/TMAO reductase YedYZ heme-binding membrane subunit